jgi:hypothetical protein
MKRHGFIMLLSRGLNTDARRGSGAAGQDNAHLTGTGRTPSPMSPHPSGTDLFPVPENFARGMILGA